MPTNGTAIHTHFFTAQSHNPTSRAMWSLVESTPNLAAHQEQARAVAAHATVAHPHERPRFIPLVAFCSSRSQ